MSIEVIGFQEGELSGFAVISHRVLWQRVAFAVQAFVLLAMPYAANAANGGLPFDCRHDRCGVPTDKPYPHLVVGTVEAIATSKVDFVYGDAGYLIGITSANSFTSMVKQGNQLENVALNGAVAICTYVEKGNLPNDGVNSGVHVPEG